MGRLFLIEFDQTSDAHYYLCRTCQTYIALDPDFQFNYIADGTIGAIFSKVVNVYTDGPNQYHKSSALTVDDGYCIKCSNLLGFKIIDTANEQGIIEGTFFLRMDKLLFWDGNQMLYADTEEPVQNA